MISFFLISLPIFGVIGVGWAATRTRLVAQGALDALNAFSFRFALPALLLRLIAGQPLRQSFNPEFHTVYLASGAIIFVLVLGTSRVVAARDLSTAAAHATTATVSNLGFLGPPLMLAFFGERGAGPLAMAILAEVMVLLSVCSVLDYRRKTRCLPNARMAHSRTDDAARCVLGECWRSDRVPAVGREYLCSRPAA